MTQRRSWPRCLVAPMLALGSLVLAGLCAPEAGAQSGFGTLGIDTPSPSRGLAIPGGAIAGDADATSSSLNPGQLGLVDGVSSALVINHWADEIAQEGRGFGYWSALPLGRPFVLGTGLEWLRPSQVDGPGNATKLTLGGGLRLGRALSVGMVWEHLFGGRHAGLDTASYGFGLRPHDVVAAGFVVRDAFRPRTLGVLLPREYDGELALRPLGDARLELAGGVRALRGGGETRWLPHARLSATLLRGLALFADFEAARTRYVDVSLAANAADWRFGVGLAASFDRLELGAAQFGTWRREPAGADASGLATPGIGVLLRTRPQRRLPLIAVRHVAKVKLEGLESDRSFLPVLLALRRLGDDPTVGAVLLDIRDLDLGYGRIEELREVVRELGRKKPVIGWLAQPGTAEYYLASACHHLAMHPAGSLQLSGLAQSVTFWKGALDKLGVAVELVRIGDWKGAMEPFVLPRQSDAVRANRNALVDDIYARLQAGVLEGRKGHGLDAGGFARVIDKALFSAAEAKDRGLVDAIADDRELEGFVHKSLGRRVSIRDANFRPFDLGRWQPRRVAVILVDGAIVDGRPKGFSPTTAGVAWSEPIIAALSAVRRDSSVRAVVLRVNSPGGSAFASDKIAREVRRFAEAKKPVVVSMADSAASGGYYIAAPASTIVASPAAITGSIGIYATKVDVSDLAAKLGVHTEVTARGALATIYSPWKPWGPGEREVVMNRLDQSYKQFLRVVADGRKARGISETRADELGRGRVFTGAQAAREGLVDRLGGFETALVEAAQRGGVPTGVGGLPEVVVLPRPIINPLDTLMALRGLASAEHDAEAAADPGDDTWREPATRPDAMDLLGLGLPQHKVLRRLLVPVLHPDPGGLEARLPFDLVVQ